MLCILFLSVSVCIIVPLMLSIHVKLICSARKTSVVFITYVVLFELLCTLFPFVYVCIMDPLMLSIYEKLIFSARKFSTVFITCSFTWIVSVCIIVPLMLSIHEKLISYARKFQHCLYVFLLAHYIGAYLFL